MYIFRYYLHRVQKTSQLRLPVRAVGSDRMSDPRGQRIPPLHANIGPSRGYPVPPHTRPRAVDLEHPPGV